jgi:hypothetical protein
MLSHFPTSLTTAVFAVVASSLLGGCALPLSSQSSSGASSEPTSTEMKIQAEAAQERIRSLGLQWSYHSGTDEMTFGTVRYAVVNSLNEVQFGFPYQGAQRASLRLRKHPRFGKDVIVTVERGQFLCHLDNCSVLVRYDEGMAWEYRATELEDRSTTALFIQGYADVVASLKKSKTVRIEAKFYQEGPRTFEFDVRNLEW